MEFLRRVWYGDDWSNFMGLRLVFRVMKHGGFGFLEDLGEISCIEQGIVFGEMMCLVI